jgi:hypothetical protein
VRYLRLVLFFLVAVSAMTSCTREAGPEPPALAQHALVLLQRADYAAVANLIYEPPSYGDAKHVQERQALTDALAYLGGEFGAPSDPRPADPRIVFYKHSIAGADISYWKSLPNFGIDQGLGYYVHFGKVGSGVLALTFIRAKKGWALRSVDFGLMPDAPQARDTMVRIGRGFLKRVSRFDEATITQLLEEMFPQPSAAKPAENSL